MLWEILAMTYKLNIMPKSTIAEGVVFGPLNRSIGTYSCIKAN